MAETTSPIMLEYLSPAITISSAGTFTLSHNFASVPKMLKGYLVCKTAEAGYSIGDIVVPAVFCNSTSNSSFTLTCTTTSVTGIFVSTATVLRINHKTTGVITALDNTYWDLYIYLWA